MPPLPTLSKKEWPVERQCDFISEFYSLLYSALIVVTFAECGQAIGTEMRYRTLHRHQQGHFLDGLMRLGIDPKKEPPAIVAGKYHYFSNALGGLDMEYMEESPKKTWIRYNAPFSPADTGWLAIPPRAGRVIFEAWHAHNAELLGCPRLGFVLTKGFTEDEPYAEGYFQEYEHDLKPSERIRFDPVATAPEFDPQRAPKLDPEEWPPERRAKAKRNFRRRYVQDTIHTILELVGTPESVHLVARASKGVAIQYGRRFLADLKVDQRNAHGLASFTKLMGDLADEPFQVEVPGPGIYLLRRTRRRLFQKDEVPVAIHRSLFAFDEMMGRILGSRIKLTVTALQEEGSGYDELRIEDTKERLL